MAHLTMKEKMIIKKTPKDLNKRLEQVTGIEPAY